MIKSILKFFLTICLIILCLSFGVLSRVKPFNADAVKLNIKVLSSGNFKGRLAGTPENEEAAYYIKNQFMNNNLMPYDTDYFQSFKVNYPKRISGKPYLKIIDKNGETLKDYIYGKDYREDALCFRRNRFICTKDSIISSGENTLIIGNAAEKFVLYTANSGSIDFRSSYMYSSPYDMYIIVTKDTLNEIKGFIDKGYSVVCFIPFMTGNASVYNVTAYIEGKNPFSAPVVICAHFDHMGCDAGGNIFYGALDNASGTAFIIEMSKYIKSLGKPERNIIFAAFNAEEYGFMGSEAFVDKYKNYLKDAKVFNFDMVGSDASLLNIAGSKNDTSKSALINSVCSECSRLHIPFNYIFENSSDHQSFREKQIAAVTFIDNDLQRIHTTKDTAEYISTNAIKRCFRIASEEIIRYSYNDNPLYSNYKDLLLISSMGVLLFSIVYIKTISKSISSKRM